MARHKAPTVCKVTGCPQDNPCPTHPVVPWANKAERRPNALSGNQLRARNRKVLRAHQGVCHVCGLAGATQVDHIVPYAEGGTDDTSNLAPIHPEPCHTAKSRAEADRGRKARRAT